MPDFAGFDTRLYPGDTSMAAWKAAGRYAFVGYYLQSDNHPDGSWRTTRQTLVDAGWGLAVVYLALPATSPNLSRQRGTADAAKALQQCTEDGFAPTVTVFLDIEPEDTLPTALVDYYRGWIRGVLDAGARPGTYCHAKNSNDLLFAAQQEYAAAGRVQGRPAFWITRVLDNTFDPAAATPTGCGRSYADLWQGAIDIQGEAQGGVVIEPTDWSVANSADPSSMAEPVTNPSPDAQHVLRHAGRRRATAK